jgi:hypothetical protein
MKEIEVELEEEASTVKKNSWKLLSIQVVVVGVKDEIVAFEEN